MHANPCLCKQASWCSMKRKQTKTPEHTLHTIEDSNLCSPLTQLPCAACCGRRPHTRSHTPSGRHVMHPVPLLLWQNSNATAAASLCNATQLQHLQCFVTRCQCTRITITVHKLLPVPSAEVGAIQKGGTKLPAHPHSLAVAVGAAHQTSHARHTLHTNNPWLYVLRA